MSDAYRDHLDLREQLARIDKALAETHKRRNESDKFAAEVREMRRDYALAVIAALGGLLGLISFALWVSGHG